MSSQIFKKSVPKEKLFELLDTICIKTNKYYLFDVNAYKKGMYNKKIQEFCEFAQPFYHTSRQYYIKRELSYSRFLTILRQICRVQNISFHSHIKYINSSYDIPYYIYLD